MHVSVIWTEYRGAGSLESSNVLTFMEILFADILNYSLHYRCPSTLRSVH